MPLDNEPVESTTGDHYARMMNMITGYWVTQIVRTAATYSLAEHLSERPATAGKSRSFTLNE